MELDPGLGCTDCPIAMSGDGAFIALVGKTSSAGTVVQIGKRAGAGYERLAPVTVPGAIRGTRDARRRFGEQGLAIAPDGKILVTVIDQSLRIWSTESQKEVPLPAVRALEEARPPAAAQYIVPSPSGRHVAAVFSTGCRLDPRRQDCDPNDDFRGRDELGRRDRGEALIIRLADASVVSHIAHTSELSSLAFSPDETLVLWGSYDATVRVTDLRSGRATQLPLSEDIARAVAFSADGRYLAAGGDRSGVHVFATADPQVELATLPAQSVTALTFSRDGRRLGVADAREGTYYQDERENHTLRVWLLDPEDLMMDARRRLGEIPEYLREPTAPITTAAAASATKQAGNPLRR
jgi:WD40 repeat protein